MILPLLNHKEKNVLGPRMPEYIVCQRISQLKNQLISSSYSSRGHKNRIFCGFWNVGYTLVLKEENSNWLFSFLKGEKKSATFEALMFSFQNPAPRCATSGFVPTCTPLHTTCEFAHTDAEGVCYRVNAGVFFSWASDDFLSSMVRWMIWTARKGKGKKSFDLSAAELI